MFRQGLQFPNAEAFVNDGRTFQFLLAEAVHTRTVPDPEVLAAANNFMGAANTLFIHGLVGRAGRLAGLTPDEAANAMAAGQLDPFADVKSWPLTAS